MKKLTIFSLAAIFCVFLPTTLLAQKGDMLAIGENRLHNGDFEEDLIQPWQLEVREDMGAAAQVEIDKKTSVSGDHSVKVTVTVPTGTAWHVKLRQDDRCFEKGEKFTVVFWCKAEKPRNVEVSFQLQHDPWTVFTNRTFPVDTEWKEYSVTFAPTVDNFQDHWFAFHVADSDILIWFDDVRYFWGEPKDEAGREVEKAVDPEAKLTTTWAQVKSGY